jgi:CHAT domain-containing protein/Flp pilus assembly protein TadD
VASDRGKSSVTGRRSINQPSLKEVAMMLAPLYRILGLWLTLTVATTQIFSQQRVPTTSADDQYKQILLLVAQQQYEHAITECKKLIEAEPQHYFAYLNLVRSARAAKQLDQVRQWLDTMLARTPPLPMAHVGIGLVYEANDESAQAIDAYRRCLQKLPDAYQPMVSLARQYLRLKKNAEGEAYFKKLVAERPANAAAHFGLGYFYYVDGQYEAALAEYEQALLFDARQPQFYCEKAVALSTASRHQEAIATLQICLNLLAGVPSIDTEKTALGLLGTLYLRVGDNVNALTYLDKSLALARETGDWKVEEYTLAQLGQLNLSLNHYSLSLEFYQQALQTSKKLIGGGYPQRHLGSLGDVYYLLGDIENARRYLRDALELSITTEDKTNQSSVLKDLARLEASENDPTRTLELYQQALDIARRRSDILLDIETSVAMSDLQRRTQRYSSALASAQHALALARGANFLIGEGNALNSLGTIHLQINELSQSEEVFESALRVGTQYGMSHIAWQAHAGLAVINEKYGQWERAREHYEQAIKLIESVRAGLSGEEQKAGYFQDKTRVYRNLARMLMRLQGQGAEAFYQTERARARAFSDLLVEAKVDLAQNLAPDLLKRQEETYRQLATLYKKLLKERAIAAEKQNRLEIARLESEFAALDEAITAWQREVRRRDPRFAALQYPDPARLQQTQETLAPGQVMLAYSLGEEESYLFALSRNRYQARKLAPAKELEEQVGKLIAAITGEPSDDDEWRRPAAKLYQLLIEPATPFLRAQPGVRELIIVPDGALHRAPFEVLLEPTKGPVTSSPKLPYLVKRYAISYTPSATVLKNLNDEWKEKRQNLPKPRKALIAFADPQCDQTAAEKSPSTIAILRAGGSEKQWKFNRLVNSEREANGIAKVFGGAKGAAEVYLRDQAKEENVKAPGRLRDYQVVHFSAHGLVNEIRPRFSGLVLTLPKRTGEGNIPEGAEDGILSAYEIFNLKLNAELVTLSACETGLGKEIKGEGLMSLARAFMHAGTPSVLASLWKVDDAGTADLMIDFYQFWREGMKVGKRTARLSKAEALRRAQLKAIVAGSQPFYWAPFVLVGRSD